MYKGLVAHVLICPLKTSLHWQHQLSENKSEEHLRLKQKDINPFFAKLFFFNFHPLEVVDRRSGWKVFEYI